MTKITARRDATSMYAWTAFCTGTSQVAPFLGRLLFNVICSLRHLIWCLPERSYIVALKAWIEELHGSEPDMESGVGSSPTQRASIMQPFTYLGKTNQAIYIRQRQEIQDRSGTLYDGQITI